jgi:hypothetical protein
MLDPGNGWAAGSIRMVVFPSTENPQYDPPKRLLGSRKPLGIGARQIIGMDTSPGVSVGKSGLSGPRIDVPFPVPSLLALAYSTVFNSFSTNPGDSAFPGILVFIFVNTTLHTQTALSTIFLVRGLSDPRSRGRMEGYTKNDFYFGGPKGI